MASETQTIIMNVQGRDDVDRLRESIRQEEDALLKAVAAQGQHSASAQAAAQNILQYQRELQKAQDVVRTTTTTTRNYQSAAMAAGYAIQDFSSANGGLVQQLQSVSNNIPQILLGIGGPGMSTGLVAGISAFVAVAAAAGPHVAAYVKELKLFGDEARGAKTQIELLRERIKDLEKKPVKLAVDTADLDDAKRKIKELEAGARAAEAAKEGKSVSEKAAGDKARTFFEANGDEFKAAFGEMKGQMVQELLGRDPEFRKGQRDKADAEQLIERIKEDMRKPGLDPAGAFGLASALKAQEDKADAAQEQMNQVMQRIIRPASEGGEAETRLGALRADVEAGNKPRSRAELAGRLRQAGFEGLAAGTELFTPQNIQEETQAQEEERIHQEQQQQRQRKIEEAKALEQQGRDAQEANMNQMAGETERDVMAVFAEPWKDFIVRARAAGASAKQEVDRLRPEVQEAVRKMSPQLERTFPDAFKGVVDGLVLKTREAVDKAVGHLQAAEGLTKEQALQRMGEAQARKGQGAEEKQALDLFSQFAGVNYNRQAAMFPEMAKLTPEMKQELGKQIQQQFEQMGVSPKEQITIARTMNATIGNPRAEAARDQAMAALMGTGLFDEAGAMRQMPNVFGLLKKGVQGPQAIDRIVQAHMRQQRNAVEQRAKEQSRTRRAPRGKARPAAKLSRGRGLRSVPPMVPDDEGGGGGFRSVPPMAPGPRAQAAPGGADGQFVDLARQGLQLQGNAINAIGSLAGTVANLKAEQARMGDALNQIMRSFGQGTHLNFRNR